MVYVIDVVYTSKQRMGCGGSKPAASADNDTAPTPVKLPPIPVELGGPTDSAEDDGGHTDGEVS